MTLENLKYFARDAAERAIKSAAQGALLSIGAQAGPDLVANGQLDLFAVAPVPVLSFALGAALLSVLTSLLSYNIGEKGTAALGRDPHKDGERDLLEFGGLDEDEG